MELTALIANAIAFVRSHQGCSPVNDARWMAIRILVLDYQRQKSRQRVRSTTRHTGRNPNDERKRGQEATSGKTYPDGTGDHHSTARRDSNRTDHVQRTNRVINMADDTLLDITWSDGKYRLVQSKSGGIKMYRHGEPWPSKTEQVVGDNCLLSLAYELEAARQALEDLKLDHLAQLERTNTDG